MGAPAEIDHLVIAARSLDEGVRWCEATLGVTPAGGGAHPLMGTHNRLLNIAADGFPRCYLEIIAIEPGKPPTRAAGLRRWFDLDDAALQAALAQRGPRLIHFAASGTRWPRARRRSTAAGCCRPRARPRPACWNGRSRCATMASASSTARCPR